MCNLLGPIKLLMYSNSKEFYPTLTANFPIVLLEWGYMILGVIVSFSRLKTCLEAPVGNYCCLVLRALW